MKLRLQQTDSFQTQARADFEQRSIAHVRKNFPEKSQDMTDEQIRERVRVCTAKGQEYEFTTEKQIICFVDMTFLLGEDFEHDPRHADIVSLMRLKGRMNPTQKAGFVLGMAFGKVKAAEEKKGLDHG